MNVRLPLYDNLGIEEFNLSASRNYLVLVSFLLLGYAFLDKGFAYLGFAPMYVSEMVLGVGLVVLLLGGVASAVLRSPITWALLAYSAWGATTALTSIEHPVFDILRDSVVWFYSAFAILVAGVLLRTGMIERPIDWYSRWIIWFLIWVPIGLVIARLYAQELPFVPGSNVRLLTLKTGDFQVHIAGAIAFFALGLHDEFPWGRKVLARSREIICWIAAPLGVIIAGSQNRGGLLAVLTVLALMAVFRPMSRLNKLILPLVLVVTVLVAIDFQMSPIRRADREYSINQIVTNIESVYEGGGSNSTASWRLDWWKTIIDYTVRGDYFWMGKGYGVNLAVDDGFTAAAGRNRSPHSGHITVLARSGVPGLFFWTVLQGTIAVSLLRRYFQAMRLGLGVLARVNLWILAYWTASIVNMSFDVYLEGPQGGIWFWCIVGYIIALTLTQDALVKQSSPAMTSLSPASS